MNKFIRQNLAGNGVTLKGFSPLKLNIRYWEMVEVHGDCFLINCCLFVYLLFYPWMVCWYKQTEHWVCLFVYFSSFYNPDKA